MDALNVFHAHLCALHFKCIIKQFWLCAEWHTVILLHLPNLIKHAQYVLSLHYIMHTISHTNFLSAVALAVFHSEHNI